MSQSDLHIKSWEAISRSIRRLVYENGLSWEMVSNMADYKGARSMENIVNQENHSLSAGRFACLLMRLSERENLTLHNHVLNPKYYMILPKPGRVTPEGSLSAEHHEMMMKVYQAEEDLACSNINGLYNYYRFLLHVAARVQSEIGELQMMLRREEENHA